MLRGRIHEAMGNIDAAAADYQNVLELNPFNDEATLLVGQLLITQERLDEAITFFDEAIDLQNRRKSAECSRKYPPWQYPLTTER